jgi:hypothetical protein
MRRALGAALAALLVAVAAGGCAKASGKAASCTQFEGGETRARWSSCPDGHVRELRCLPSGDHDTKCDCLDNGKADWFFITMGYPALTKRKTAETVARQNCPLWSSR